MCTTRPLLVTALSIVTAATAGADSPLSSTDIASAYADVAVVRDVRTSRALDADALDFLVGPAPTDEKAAVVNALGWGGDAAARATPFVTAVAAARGVALDALRLDHLTASDRFVLGYLLAMGESPGPLRAGSGAPAGASVWSATPRDLLAQAARALPRDFTVQYVRALVDAQDAMSSSWCAVYMGPQEVLDRFPARRRNMRPKAVEAVQGYIRLYEKECGEVATRPDAAVPALGPEANQIYALARIGPHVAAATQWGAVIWDPDRKVPIASHREEICVSALAWGSGAWIGCDARVLHWDGKVWKSYLHVPDADGSQYAVTGGPDGSLLAVYGDRVMAYDPGPDAFTAAPIRVGERAADLLVRDNGDTWWIEFMRGIHGPDRTYAVGSSDYPGTDPRRVVETADGRLFVLDFRSGAFRLSDDGRFVAVHGVAEKASAVAVDPVRDRTWLLHYTQGPVLVEHGAVPREFDTSDLEYMRDMIVDPDGSIWVAGWNKLLHLRDTPRGWKREELIAR